MGWGGLHRGKAQLFPKPGVSPCQTPRGDSPEFKRFPAIKAKPIWRTVRNHVCGDGGRLGSRCPSGSPAAGLPPGWHRWSPTLVTASLAACTVLVFSKLAGLAFLQSGHSFSGEKMRRMEVQDAPRHTETLGETSRDLAQPASISHCHLPLHAYFGDKQKAAASEAFIARRFI